MAGSTRFKVPGRYKGVTNMQEINNTQYFKVEKGPELRVSDVLAIVYRALMEKGYNPGESDCWIYYVGRSYLYHQS